MSLRQFLDIVYPGKPAFLKDSWIQGVPVRHIYMAGTVRHYLRTASAPPRILEIGSWMGSSCLTWCEALRRFGTGEGHVVCVDPLVPYFDVEANKRVLDNPSPKVRASQSELIDEMHTLLQHDFVYDILMHNVSIVPAPTQVTVIRKTSTEALPELPDGSFDIVYVDGDHAYDAARYDIAQAARLVREGGIVCGDDLEVQMHQVDVEFARANAHRDFPTDPRTGRQFHPGVTLAVGELVGPVKTYVGYWVAQRKDGRLVPMQLEKMPVMIPEHFPIAIQDQIRAMVKQWRKSA